MDQKGEGADPPEKNTIFNTYTTKDNTDSETIKQGKSTSKTPRTEEKDTQAESGQQTFPRNSNLSTKTSIHEDNDPAIFSTRASTGAESDANFSTKTDTAKENDANLLEKTGTGETPLDKGTCNQDQETLPSVSHEVMTKQTDTSGEGEEEEACNRTTYQVQTAPAPFNSQSNNKETDSCRDDKEIEAACDKASELDQQPPTLTASAANNCARSHKGAYTEEDENQISQLSDSEDDELPESGHVPCIGATADPKAEADITDKVPSDRIPELAFRPQDAVLPVTRTVASVLSGDNPSTRASTGAENDADFSTNSRKTSGSSKTSVEHTRHCSIERSVHESRSFNSHSCQDQLEGANFDGVTERDKRRLRLSKKNKGIYRNSRDHTSKTFESPGRVPDKSTKHKAGRAHKTKSQQSAQEKSKSKQKTKVQPREEQQGKDVQLRLQQTAPLLRAEGAQSEPPKTTQPEFAENEQTGPSDNTQLRTTSNAQAETAKYAHLDLPDTSRSWSPGNTQLGPSEGSELKPSENSNSQTLEDKRLNLEQDVLGPSGDTQVEPIIKTDSQSSKGAQVKIPKDEQFQTSETLSPVDAQIGQPEVSNSPSPGNAQSESLSSFDAQLGQPGVSNSPSPGNKQSESLSPVDAHLGQPEASNSPSPEKAQFWPQETSKSPSSEDAQLGQTKVSNSLSPGNARSESLSPEEAQLRQPDVKYSLSPGNTQSGQPEMSNSQSLGNAQSESPSLEDAQLGQPEASNSPSTGNTQSQSLLGQQEASNSPSTENTQPQSLLGQPEASNSPSTGNTQPQSLLGQQETSNSPSTENTQSQSLLGQQETSNSPSTENTQSQSLLGQQEASNSPSTGNTQSQSLLGQQEASNSPSPGNAQSRSLSPEGAQLGQAEASNSPSPGNAQLLPPDTLESLSPDDAHQLENILPERRHPRDNSSDAPKMQFRAHIGPSERRRAREVISYEEIGSVALRRKEEDPTDHRDLPFRRDFESDQEERHGDILAVAEVLMRPEEDQVLGAEGGVGVPALREDPDHSTDLTMQDLIRNFGWDSSNGGTCQNCGLRPAVVMIFSCHDCLCQDCFYQSDDECLRCGEPVEAQRWL